VSSFKSRLKKSDGFFYLKHLDENGIKLDFTGDRALKARTAIYQSR
jgi:hypothetical protein